MPKIPKQIDEQIKQRFDELIVEANQLIQDIKLDDQILRTNQGDVLFAGELHDQAVRCHSLKTKYISLLEYVLGNGLRASELKSQIEARWHGDSYSIKTILGVLVGLKSDYEAGMLRGFIEMMEAEITADYLGQAEQLLKEGQPGKYNHVPAAVLTGAILEDALRRLCQRQNPPVPTIKANGEPKTLNTYIDDLKKAGVFNEPKAQQIRSWAAIRNAAAHGEFEKFRRQDVEQMYVGVQGFLADYL